MSTVSATRHAILIDGEFAKKLARREGLRVYLYTMGSKWIRQELKAHADLVLETQELIAEPAPHR